MAEIKTKEPRIFPRLFSRNLRVLYLGLNRLSADRTPMALCAQPAVAFRSPLPPCGGDCHRGVKALPLQSARN
ncbi:MAG: hypothetical protein IJ393_03930 [Clostridia bacterium]|nr:hypothetical protein [Clostridia bacterium]